ncbi:MAG: hypothetical protein CMO34_07215, partial [Verrucomicrobia bacterium]|nr:hypothetical protein [Verrucomicrobiota bacterium]
MPLIKRLFSYGVSIVFFLVLFLSSNIASAQVAEGINYQAVARDNNGNILGNQVISVRFGLISGSSTGTLEYEEEHNLDNQGLPLTTNQFGLFNLIIGQGANTGNGATSSFANLDWGSAKHFLKVEIDAGNGFENLGTTELVSVPYAQYAKSAGNSLKAGDGIEIRNDSVINTGDLSSTNESISRFELLNDTLIILNEGNRIDTLNLGRLFNNQLKLQFGGNDLYNLSIVGGNQIQFSVADDDSDALNEIQSLMLNATSDTLRLTNGGVGVALADLNISDDQQLSRNGNTLELTGDNPSSVDLTSLLGVDSLRSLNDTTIRVFNADGTTRDVVIRGQAVDTSNTNELIDTMYYSNATLKYVQQGVLDSVNLDSVAAGQRLILRGLFIANRNRLNQLQSQFSVDSALTIQNRDSIDALVNRINSDSLLRYINDTALNGQLRDTSAVLRALIQSSNTDDQQLSFNATLDTIRLEDGGAISIKDIRDSLSNYNTRLQTNASDIVANQGNITTNSSNINANAQGIVDSTASVENRLGARINADSLLRYINDTALNGQLRDTSAILRSLIQGANTDDQNLIFRDDSLFIVNGDSGIYLGMFRDTAAINELSARLNVSRLNFSIDSTLSIQNRDSIDAVVSQINALKAADTDTDSLNERIRRMFIRNDSIIIMEADSTFGVDLSALNNPGTDNQGLRISNDSILIERGDGIDISYLMDSIRQNAARIQSDSIRISENLNLINSLSNRLDVDSIRLDNQETNLQNLNIDVSGKFSNDSIRIASDSIRLNNALINSGNLAARFETDSVLQDQDSIRLDNFRTQYSADSTLNKTV